MTDGSDYYRTQKKYTDLELWERWYFYYWGVA